MVDAVNVFNDFNTAEFLTDRHGKVEVPEDDDRKVSDSQVDQIEFANVLIINKCDLVSKEEVNRTNGLIKALNSNARILTSVKSRVDIGNLLNTCLLNYEKASFGAGLLCILIEEVNPEEEEYGIGSFVFCARRPFHPDRLWQVISDHFSVIQDEFVDDGFDEAEASDAGEDVRGIEVSLEHNQKSQDESGNSGENEHGKSEEGDEKAEDEYEDEDEDEDKEN